jgi:membrane protease YdiL (CAAX protease family)
MDLNAANNQGACGTAQGSIPVRSWQPLEILTLTVLGMASVGLIKYTDLLLYRATMYSVPAAAWIPDARVTSCLITLALYILVGKRWPTPREALQNKDAYWMASMSAAWLTTTAVAVFWFRVYVPPVHGVVETAAFLVFGMMAEEFLFRGALFSVAKQLGGNWFATFASAIFFSLSHFQYHSYHLTPAAIAQVSYTLPMGVTFGFLRQRSDRLWPAIVVHFINNGMVLLR